MIWNITQLQATKNVILDRKRYRGCVLRVVGSSVVS